MLLPFLARCSDAAILLANLIKRDNYATQIILKKYRDHIGGTRIV